MERAQGSMGHRVEKGQLCLDESGQAGICTVLKREKEGRALQTEGGHDQRRRGQTAGMGT